MATRSPQQMHPQSSQQLQATVDRPDPARKSRSVSLPDLDFRGFPDFESNVVYCPIQAFTVLIPNHSRGCVRIVLYMIRKTLGWLDSDGEPLQERFRFTFDELQKHAGVGRDAISEALGEAEKGRFIQVVQRPRKKAQGVSGQSGIYELRWDRERYTNDPREFDGFYEKGTYVTSAGEPQFARKNIPNALFDITARREPLAVLRVVAALLFYSIQWGRGGERKTPVRKSGRELARLAHMTRGTITKALKIAVDHHYIERVECGVIDFSSRQESVATLYGVNWTKSWTYSPQGELLMIQGRDEQSEKASRANSANSRKKRHGTVGKGVTDSESHQSEKASRNSRKKSTREQSEKAPHKELKQKRSKTLKRDNTTTAPEGAAAGVAVHEFESSFELLKSQGIGHREAQRLAETHEPESIRRQVDWLPARNPRTNPAGLLRIAIEQDLPEPLAAKLPTSVVSDETPEANFAAHFYAGFHGNAGRPIAVPSANDTQAARIFLARLCEICPKASDEQISGWGRDFGKSVFEHQRFKDSAIISFVAALRSYGDEFFKRFSKRHEEERSRARWDAIERAQKAHEERFAEPYLDYLRAARDDLQRQAPELWDEFLAERERQLTGGGFHEPSQEIREKFGGEDVLLRALQEFLGHDDEHPLLDFWDWDDQMNENSFDEDAL